MDRSIRLAFGMILILAGVDSFCANVLGDDKTKERFLREYPPALEKLKEQYSHVRGKARTIFETPLRGNQGLAREESVSQFYFDGTRSKVKTEIIGEPRVVGTPQIRTSCTSPGLSFIADIPTAGDPVALFFLGSGAVDDAAMRRTKRFRARCLMAPWVAISSTELMLKTPEFVLVDAELTQKDGHELIIVHYAFQDRPQKPGDPAPMLHNRLTFLPAEGWILKEFEFNPGRVLSTGRMQYETHPNKPATLKRLDFDTGRDKESIVFEEFVFGATDPAEFTLRSVGLPDADDKPAPRTKSRTSGRLNTAGALAVVSAFIVRVCERH